MLRFHLFCMPSDLLATTATHNTSDVIEAIAPDVTETYLRDLTQGRELQQFLMSQEAVVLEIKQAEPYQKVITEPSFFQSKPIRDRKRKREPNSLFDALSERTDNDRLAPSKRTKLRETESETVSHRSRDLTGEHRATRQRAKRK